MGFLLKNKSHFVSLYKASDVHKVRSVVQRKEIGKKNCRVLFQFVCDFDASQGFKPRWIEKVYRSSSGLCCSLPETELHQDKLV